MTIRTAHFDRLSALLEGARPRIEIIANDCPAPKGVPSLFICLLNRGTAAARLTAGWQTLHAPAMLFAGTLSGDYLQPDDDAEILKLLVILEGPAGPLLVNQFPTLGAFELADGSNDALARIAALISQEASAPRCGHPALLRHAGDILFIALLRQQIEHPEKSGELFRALADPKLAKALVAMHENPAADWRLETLAERAGMSRTAFANGFRLALGQPPGAYLTRLRLSLAKSQLKKGKSLKETARNSGYASASALSRALARNRPPHSPDSQESPAAPTTAMAMGEKNFGQLA